MASTAKMEQSKKAACSFSGFVDGTYWWHDDIEDMKHTERESQKSAINVLNFTKAICACTQVEAAPGQEGTPWKIVLKRKLDEHGCVACYEAHLVAKGYNQKDVVHYGDTFAPFLPYYMLLLIVGKFSTMDCVVHHANILTDFLSSVIDGHVYAKRETFSSKLNINLYRLKQSLRPWYKRIKKIIEDFTFKQV